MSHGKIYTVIFMVVLSVVFGAAIAGLSIVSQPIIEKNNRLLTQRAYVSLFGLGDVETLTSDEIRALVADFVEVSGQPISDPRSGTQFQVLKAYADRERTQLKAIAFNFRGLGFWAPIEGLMALTPDRSRTIGLIITAQKETPGLGGRIEEPIFTDPFSRQVLVSQPADSSQKWIVISSTEPPAGTEMAERHVQAITGATQTCMAMDTILNNALQAFNRAFEHVESGRNDGIQ